jgi:hypothetical protein
VNSQRTSIGRKKKYVLVFFFVVIGRIDSMKEKSEKLKKQGQEKRSTRPRSNSVPIKVFGNAGLPGNLRILLRCFRSTAWVCVIDGSPASTE